jgi:hypothetical protein
MGEPVEQDASEDFGAERLGPVRPILKRGATRRFSGWLLS